MNREVFDEELPELDGTRGEEHESVDVLIVMGRQLCDLEATLKAGLAEIAEAVKGSQPLPPRKPRLDIENIRIGRKP